MGLDPVELIIAVESEFGITIPDREAKRIRTVGDLYRNVHEKLEIRASTDGGETVCLPEF